MTIKDILGVAMAIVTLAIVAVIVQSQYTSSVITKLTTGFGYDIGQAKNPA